MFRASVLALAVLLSAPTIWAALGAQTISVQAALLRFLIAVPIAAVLLAMLRTAGKRNRPGRR